MRSEAFYNGSPIIRPLVFYSLVIILLTLAIIETYLIRPLYEES